VSFAAPLPAAGCPLHHLGDQSPGNSPPQQLHPLLLLQLRHHSLPESPKLPAPAPELLPLQPENQSHGADAYLGGRPLGLFSQLHQRPAGHHCRAPRVPGDHREFRVHQVHDGTDRDGR
jgi:hypothetical protein